jgi:hypothetical protein
LRISRGASQEDIEKDLQILKAAGITEKDIQNILDRARKDGIPEKCAVS